MDTSRAAQVATAAASSYSRPSNRWMYEVFLSFRGDDTRNTFTDHLDIALRKAGINTFIDYQLRRGEKIQSELDRELEGSRIAVVVFSMRYAESQWCLRELAKIMRCREDQKGKIVYPIFYDVDPSEVRKQSGGFGEAFRKHERDEDPNEVQQWRKDLKASADLGGRNLKITADGYVECIKLTGSYKHFSKELRLLSWLGFPLEAIPADFDLRNLVYIDLRYSKLVRVWEDSDLLPVKLNFLEQRMIIVSR